MRAKKAKEIRAIFPQMDSVTRKVYRRVKKKYSKMSAKDGKHLLDTLRRALATKG